MRKSNDSSLILDLFEDMFGVEQADEIYALFDDNFEDVVNFFQSEQFQKAGRSLSSQRSELPTNTNP
jgi:hypothetical protein